MAFPTPEDVTPSYFSAATSHAVAMPATVVAGQALVVLLGDDASTTVTTPSGWSIIEDAEFRCRSYIKVADGSEGGTTVDFVTSGSREMAAHVYRVSGWYGAISGGVFAGTPVVAAASTPNPPDCAPGVGAEDFLWITFVGHTTSGATINSAPTNYSGYTETNDPPGANDIALASAYRQLNASSENPGTFAGTTSKAYGAQTIAIRPSPPIQYVSVSGAAGAFTGTLTKSPRKVLAGAWDAPSGALATAHTFAAFLAGSMGAVSGVLSRNTAKQLTGNAGTFAGTLLKSTTVHLAGAWAAPSATLAVLKASFVNLAGAWVAPSGTLRRDPRKVIAGSWAAPTGTLTKSPRKVLAGAWAAPSGALSTVKSYLRAFSGSAGTFSGVLTKSPRKVLSGTVGAMSGVLTKSPRKPVSGAWGAPTGTLTRIRWKTLTGTMGAVSGTLTKRTAKSLSGTWAAPTGSLLKRTTVHLSGATGTFSGLLAAFNTSVVNIGLLPGATRFGQVAKGAARFAANHTGIGRFFRPPPGSGRMQ